MNESFQPKRPMSAVQEEILTKMLAEVSKKDFKAISFKMQDTLVLTPFSQPEDLFLFMEEDFALCNTGKKSFTELRIAAQIAAEKKYSQKSSVTLEKIYNIFAKLSGVGAPPAKKLMERECELIRYFSFPRKCGKALFDEAKRLKKKVMITSVSVYPREVVTDILKSCGYGEYDALIIPAELGIADIAESAFLDAVTEKSKVQPKELLHIGGDFSNDVEAPIVRGIKALMLQPVLPLMTKSGRLRGFVEQERLYDISEGDALLALRCAFALYAAYGFDIPQNKMPKSDFCSDEYMLGFIVLGPLSLIKNFSPENGMQEELIAAMHENPDIMDGSRDFEDMLYHHFGEFIGKYGGEGCQLPLEFLEKYSYAGDRSLVKEYLSDKGAKSWGTGVKEPKLAPVHSGREAVKKNSLQKLADKLFPEGTRVRNITESILHKGKNNK